jgi:DNA-binding HxlR family transcriptional regulator
MTIETKILKDLDVGSTTVSSLRERIQISEGALEAILKRLQQEGIVDSRILYPSNLLVWYKVNSRVKLQPQFHEL